MPKPINIVTDDVYKLRLRKLIGEILLKRTAITSSKHNVILFEYGVNHKHEKLLRNTYAARVRSFLATSVIIGHNIFLLTLV